MNKPNLSSELAAPSAEEMRNRLMWRSRRGMLELDLLLQGYIETYFETLTPTQIEAFTRLLETPDTVLLDFLLGRSQPTDAVMADTVNAVRGQ